MDQNFVPQRPLFVGPICNMSPESKRKMFEEPDPPQGTANDSTKSTEELVQEVIDYYYNMDMSKFKQTKTKTSIRVFNEANSGQARVRTQYQGLTKRQAEKIIYEYDTWTHQLYKDFI